MSATILIVQRSRAWSAVVVVVASLLAAVLLVGREGSGPRASSSDEARRATPIVLAPVSGASAVVDGGTPAAAVSSATSTEGRVLVHGCVRFVGNGRFTGQRVVATRGADVVEASSDDDGEFAIALSPGEWTVELGFGSMSFEARLVEPAELDAGAWPEDTGTLNPPVGGRSAPLTIVPGETRVLDLRIRSTVRIEGRVVADETGAPIPGATVEPLRGYTRATTDARGAFAIVLWPGLHAGGDPTPRPAFVVRAPGRAPAAIRSTAGGYLHRMILSGLEVRLVPALHLRGRVVDPAGAPLADVLVEVHGRLPDEGGATREDADHEPRPVAWTWSTKTASDGTFAVDDLAPDGARDQARVQVSARLPGRSQVETCEPLVGPSGADVRVVLAPDAEVSGIVVDPAGAPIAGARVARYDVARPDHDPGMDRSPPPRGPRFARDRFEHTVFVDLGPGRFGEGETLLETVEWARKHPRPGEGRVVASARDGRFRLSGLVANRQPLAVSAPGHGEVFVEVDAPATERRIVLAPERVVCGRVTEARAPLANAEVRVVRAGAGPAAARAFDLGWDPAWDDRDERGAALTDADGRFEVRGLADATVDLIVVDLAGEVVLSRGGVPTGAAPLELEAASTCAHVHVAGVSAASGEALLARVQCFDEAGDPLQRLGPDLELPGADRVYWGERGREQADVAVHARGPFTVVIGAFGQKLAVRRADPTAGPEVALGQVSLRPGGGRVDLRIARARAPVRGHEVVLSQPTTGVRWRARIEAGASRWLGPWLEPGDVEVTLVTTGLDGESRRRSTMVRVIEGESTPVELSPE